MIPIIVKEAAKSSKEAAIRIAEPVACRASGEWTVDYRAKKTGGSQ
jgi:hypothetical protein